MRISKECKEYREYIDNIAKEVAEKGSAKIPLLGTVKLSDKKTKSNLTGEYEFKKTFRLSLNFRSKIRKALQHKESKK
jgi:Holliday junction resolvase RusA-like endonuclease